MSRPRSPEGWERGEPSPPRCSAPVALAVALMVCLAAPALANPIMITGTEYGWVRADSHLLRNLALVTIAALSLEYVAYRQAFARWLPLRRALPIFLGIHAISWPLTQVAGAFLTYFFAGLPFDLTPAAEAVPICLEGAILLKVTGARAREERRHVLWSVVACNLLSFIAGWVLLASLGYHKFQDGGPRSGPFPWILFAAVGSALVLGVGRGIWLLLRGVRVVAVDRRRGAGEAAADLLLVLILVAWAFAVAAGAEPSGWTLAGILEGPVLLDHPAVRAAGTGLAIDGAILYGLALAALGRSWRIGIDRECPGPLATGGVFEWTRNPIYLALDLLAAGAFLVLGRPALLVLGALLALLLHRLILREERFLEEAYGDTYRAYRDRVGRYGTLPGTFGGGRGRPSASTAEAAIPAGSAGPIAGPP